MCHLDLHCGKQTCARSLPLRLPLGVQGRDSKRMDSGLFDHLTTTCSNFSESLSMTPHLNIFTPFCPLHATNVHAASQCKAWQTKLAMQRSANTQRGQEREARTDKRAESNDAARTSRDKERNTF